jgi:hypothetical protein
MQKYIAAIALALLVTGCGSSDDTSITMKDSDGKEIKINSSEEKVNITDADGKKTEIASDTKLPADFPEYPGASNVEVTNIKSPEGSLTTAKFTTSDEPAQVIAFYKAQFAEKKIPIALETTQEDMAMIMSGENTQSAMQGGNVITVTAQKDDNTTTVSALINSKAE